MIRLYAFVAVMWGLIILGGGFAVQVLGPLDTGAGPTNSVLKGGIAVAAVVLWIVLLVRIRRVMLR